MKTHREQVGEFRARFGSVPGGLSIVQRRDLAMISVLRSLRRQGLLIRRSWVRNPPGSYSLNPTSHPHSSPLALGSFKGKSPFKKPIHLVYGRHRVSDLTDMPTKRCRDCHGYFAVTDVRRVLCDGCRRWNRRAIIAKASRKWYASLSPQAKRGLITRKWRHEKLKALRGAA